jgi:hypothetical protein
VSEQKQGTVWFRWGLIAWGVALGLAQYALVSWLGTASPWFYPAEVAVLVAVALTAYILARRLSP